MSTCELVTQRQDKKGLVSSSVGRWWRLTESDFLPTAAAGRRPKEAFVFSASRVSHGSQYLVIGGIVLGKVASNQKFCELPNTLFLK